MSGTESWPPRPVRAWPLVSLVAANAISIVFAVVNRWDLAPLMRIYWAQGVIIGFFHVFRILSLQEFSTAGLKINGRPVAPTPATKRKLASSFAVIFGGFNLVYLIFLSADPALLGRAPPAAPAAADYWSGGLSILAFAANTFIAFLSFRKRIARLRPQAGSLFFAPFLRIVPIHLVIIAGGFVLFGAEGRGGLELLLLFLLLKALTDVLTHLAEDALLGKADRVWSLRIKQRMSRAGGKKTAIYMSALFNEQPFQWGLRGDPGLWAAMREYFARTLLPATEKEVCTLFTDAFFTLTGKSLSGKQDFYSGEFDRGGMSAGMISMSFWNDDALPLIVKAFRTLLANE